MLKTPRLKQYLTLYPISETAWGIRGGGGEFWSIKLHDERAMRAFSAMLPFLNGSRSSTEILAEVEKMGLDAAVAEKLLKSMESNSLIEEMDSAGLSEEKIERHREQISFLSRFGEEGGAKYQAKLDASRVAVIAQGTLASILCRQLSEAGIGRVTYLADGDAPEDLVAAAEKLSLERPGILSEDSLEPKPDLVIVAVSYHDPELLEAMDTFSKTHGVPWLLIRASEHLDGWVGPLFIPRDTASYVSFEARLRGNMETYDQYVDFDNYLRQPEKKAVAVGGLRPFFEVLAGIAVTEAVKHLTDVFISALAGKFISVDLVNLDTEIHEVLRFPRIEDESYSRPGVFPWKELPVDVPRTRRA